LTKKVLIAAVSSRPFVKAAAQAGYAVTAIDVFADADTQRYAEHVYKVEYANSGFEPKHFEAVLDLLDLSQFEGFAYGSGFEAQPDLLARIQKRLPLIGNPPEVIQRLKYAPDFFSLLTDLSIPHPEVGFEALDQPEGWLCKEAGGSGGTHVLKAKSGADLPHGHYYQRIKPGVPVSMLFAADGQGIKVVGFNRQWIAPVVSKPYRYGGIVGHTELPVGIKQAMQETAAKITQAIGLRGMNSLDVVLNKDEFWVLEINPRLSSTLDLYQSPVSNLFDLHRQAVAGDLSHFPAIPQTAKARHVLYATQDLTIPEIFAWPEWTADIPMPLSCIPHEQPICTVLAEAKTAHEARDLVLARVQQLSELLFN
jgi:predicted ATP-grasp superfamily ATP-dependent carboligase